MQSTLVMSDEDARKQLGKTLRKGRLQKKLSLRSASDQLLLKYSLPICHMSIQRIEEGKTKKVNFSIILCLLSLYDCPFEDALSGFIPD